MRPSVEHKNPPRPLVPEVISDESKSTALVQTGKALPQHIKKEPIRDLRQREGFEFYIGLGDKRTLDQVAKKLKVPLSLVEIWKKDYFWDIKLPLCIDLGSIEAAENALLQYVKLAIAEFTMPAPPGSVPIVPSKKRFIDLGQGQTAIVPENVVINPAKASSKKASEYAAILRDLQRSAIERHDKRMEVMGPEAIPENDQSKGPKTAVQVNVTIIKS